jgi:hypothetical protein
LFLVLKPCRTQKTESFLPSIDIASDASLVLLFSLMNQISLQTCIAPYGVVGIANGGRNAFGVYGGASGGTSFNAAGYFNGSLWAVGPLHSISDRKFKQDIQPIKQGLEQVLKLKPAVYTFKSAEYKGMHLPQGKQLGLIADEVKQVFPELVAQGVHPAEYDKDDRTKVISPEVKYEGVNYQGLIPVLIASIQEQQQQIEEKDNRIAALESGMAELRHLVLELKNGRGGTLTSASGYLEQNTPNPVKASTRISYSLPEGAAKGQLLLSDALGRTLKVFRLSTSGTVNVDAAGLSSGTYNYSLLVDGKTVQTRKMTVVN